jgi:hypothetical protein
LLLSLYENDNEINKQEEFSSFILTFEYFRD